jgi:hypothetical protein
VCDDISIQITTYNKADNRDHFYLSGDSDGKGLHVVKEKTFSTMKKDGSKYYVKDQHGKYIEGHSGSMDVDLTNREDSDGQWAVTYDSGSNDYYIQTNENLHSSGAVGGHRRRAQGKNSLAFSDRGTDVKLLKQGSASNRERWYIDPAYCAVLDSDNVVGKWQWIEDVAHAGTEKQKHGYDLKIDEHFFGEFSAKLKGVMKAGFNVGFAKAKGKVEAKFSADLTADVSADLEIYKETEFDVTWKDKDVHQHVWQWVFDLQDQGISNCGGHTTLKTSQFMLTPKDTDRTTTPPCCLPGTFSSGDWDTCTSKDVLIPGSGSACKTKGHDDFTV